MGAEKQVGKMSSRRCDVYYMQAELRIVALYVKVPAYGTETFLGWAYRRGMETAVRRVAFRGAPSRQDISNAEPA